MHIIQVPVHQVSSKYWYREKKRSGTQPYIKVSNSGDNIQMYVFDTGQLKGVSDKIIYQ